MTRPEEQRAPLDRDGLTAAFDAHAQDVFAARREHLMSEATVWPGLSRRAKTLIGSLLAALAVGGGTVALAGVPGVTRQDNGVVRIDQNGLDAWHQGRVLTADEVEDLRAEGRAGYSAQSVELACHGVVAYFDTTAEADAYGTGYTARVKEIAAEREALAPGTDPADTDPCAWWKDPIPGMSELR